jgi:hypothetical protein
METLALFTTITTTTTTAETILTILMVEVSLDLMKSNAMREYHRVEV